MTNEENNTFNNKKQYYEIGESWLCLVIRPGYHLEGDTKVHPLLKLEIWQLDQLAFSERTDTLELTNVELQVVQVLADKF
jgi:hypothetical protein